MLSDRVAIELVEKCVRYHIFASFNLARLHLSGFDQTMNTENLQKSLQSLRHMYSDIERMAGGQCANEAEFRSYDIILNLSDPNVHSQAITYRDEVRSSAEVRLALSLATAFQSNNYVRFFRELKTNGSYLQVGLDAFYSLLKLPYNSMFFSAVSHTATSPPCDATHLRRLHSHIGCSLWTNSLRC